MLEKFLLAVIATLCFYLFFQMGNTAPKSDSLGNNLVRVSSFFTKNLIFSH